MQQEKVELLIPAGNLEKLEIAINYGADAIYLSGKNFSLRNFSNNFTLKEMYLARNLTLKKKVKMYVAVNIFSRNNETTLIDKYLGELRLIQPDGIIIADPSIFVQVKRLMPEIPIHISTQSNTTNFRTALFWQSLGAKRINTARELTLKEIEKIVHNSKIEVETFVHGSMCMAYSGRCLMSNFMTQRESNQGMCCQPCRFNYTIMEAKRPGEYFPIYEDDRGSYILSSKDLCMIDHIPNLIESGIKSFKIEGRMKSINYVATITKIYREAIDVYYHDISLNNYNLLSKNWHKQLNKINNRGYCHGFFFNNPNEMVSKYVNEHNYEYQFVAKVIQPTFDEMTCVNVRNKIFLDDQVEVLSPLKISEKRYRIKEIINEKGVKCDFAQPGSNVNIRIDNICEPLDLIRTVKNVNENKFR